MEAVDDDQGRVGGLEAVAYPHRRHDDGGARRL